MIFEIGVREVWEQKYAIEAESYDEAIRKLSIDKEECEIMQGEFEYCYTMLPLTWTNYGTKK